MDKHDLKKILAGISIASLLTGAGIGCASQQQQTSAPSEEISPAQTEPTKAPGKEAPAPSS